MKMRKVWLASLVILFFFRDIRNTLITIAGLPIIGVLMVLVRLTSRGPAIYSQVRVGKDNKPYTMYKLRSMRIDAEETSGPVWSQENDPRVTPIGRILRDRHLDELPQLINVIRGEMSAVYAKYRLLLTPPTPRIRGSVIVVRKIGVIRHQRCES